MTSFLVIYEGVFIINGGALFILSHAVMFWASSRVRLRGRLNSVYEAEKKYKSASLLRHLLITIKVTNDLYTNMTNVLTL